MTDAPATATAYALPAELRAAILAYLMQRPYAEVAQGIQALEALAPLEAPANG